jgi:large subunit ribosomal protein L5
MKHIHDKRTRAEMAIRGIIDTAADEKRDLSGEDEAAIDKLDAESRELADRLGQLLEDEKRSRDLDEALGSYAPAVATEDASVPNYNDEIRAALKESLGLGNIMEVPRFEKIVINSGVGKALAQSSLIEGASRDLELISGQKVIVTKAKKSVAAFKLREGNAIGVKVTLRGDRMWEFLDRLISLAIPRIRDFRGLPPKAFDGHGNYTFGVQEQLMFPEMEYDKIDATRGFDITIVTTARTNAEGKALLDAFGFPFKREGQQ